MTPDPKPGTVLGSHGETLSKPPDSIADLNLPPGVQALIEARIIAAVEDLKEDNRKEIREVNRQHTRRWKIIAIFSVAFAFISWFIAPQQFRKWAKDYVQKRMTAPELKKAADAAIASQMGEYVKGQLEGLKQDIDKKQKQLGDDQTTLREQVKFPELVIAAKTGNLAAYLQIVTKSEESGQTQNAAKAALHEVELYYDFDAAQIFYPTWTDVVSNQNPGWSVEELLWTLHKHDDNPTDRIAIINTIGQVGGTESNAMHALPELYTRLSTEKDLRVRTRLVWAINIIADQEFRPLDFDGCMAWWNLHKEEPAYAPIYADFLRIVESSGPDVQDLIEASDRVIRIDPRALFARCAKTSALVQCGRYSDAEKEILEAEKIAEDYRWILYEKAHVYVKQNKIIEAVEALNSAMQKSPGLEKELRSDRAFAAIITHPGLRFPSQSTKR
jgi:tetratricopeptide (TPR) repeat protein